MRQRYIPALPLAPMLGLGFASGLPLPLSSFTLQQWLVTSGVSTAAAGAVITLGLAYTVKFLWSPLFDRAPPWPVRSLGRRRGWLLLVQPALAAAIALLAATEPARHLAPTLAAAALVAFLSASQDIVIDAWRIETYPEAAQGKALAFYVWGYRLAMLAANSGVIFASTLVGWHGALLAAASVPLAGALLTLRLAEPAIHGAAAPVAGIAAFLEPVRELLARPGMAMLLAFVVLFRLGKVLADGTAAAFYRYALHFGSHAVAAANFLPGLVGTFAGAATGGVLVARLGTWPALLLTGLLQTASLGLYLMLLATGPDPLALDLKVGLEAFGEAAASGAFLTFISTLCAPAHTATQYALLSSLAALVFHTVGGTAGLLASRLGFPLFYALTIAASLPALLLLFPLRAQNKLYRAPSKG